MPRRKRNKRIAWDVSPIPALPTLLDIQAFQAEVLNHPQIECPLNHYFAPNMYAREITMPADSIVVGKMHRFSHVNNLSKGRLIVVTTTGRKEMIAPCQWVSEAGAKRTFLILEESVLTTYHPTNETDLDKLEAELIVPEDQAHEFLSDLETKRIMGE